LELYTRIAGQYNVKVNIYRRKPYLSNKIRNLSFKNIKFIDFSVPKKMYLEAFLHSFYSSIHALFQGYDIVHVHNIGPGFFIPLLRLTGAKVVLTYHSISYTHEKWNYFAKKFLYLSEKISLPCSDFVIFISKIIESEMVKKYTLKDFKLIHNGVNIPEKSANTDYIESLGLEKHRYIVAIGRYIEEKGFDYMIRAYRKADITDYKLVIVGDADYLTDYSKRLKSFAKENNVILTGFIKGEKLNQIFSSARLFIMPSFSEGLPIALLEAMSFKVDVLVSDIPANLQIGLPEEDYFSVGNENALKEKILCKLSRYRERDYTDILTRNFDWDNISLETYLVYKNLVAENKA